ncbi:MAG: lysophospholipid acyltransferase family protein [Deltaproteobacteria bacterium]|jgi:KDO2-lipid IV(A) lauroyltransferase|nr:lysophospholipid acyltransferase family protein [Deltaproteobacteria bacterium]
MRKQGKKDSLIRLSKAQKIYLSLLYALAAFLRLFGLRGIRYLARLGASIFWLLARKRRAFAIGSVMQHLGRNKAEATNIARKSITSNAQSFMEMLFTKSFPLDNNPRLRTNAIFSERMCREEGSVVAVTGHLGAWELMASLLGSFRTEHPALIVVRDQKSPVFNTFFHDMRSPGNSISIGHRNAAAEVVSALREKGTACFLVDHNTLRKEAIYLPFLGEVAAVNLGPAILALRGRAKVYPVFLFRTPENRYELEATEPLDTAKLEGSIQERATQIAEFYTRAVELAVKEHPEQWLWAHKRWKTRPPDALPK